MDWLVEYLRRKEVKKIIKKIFPSIKGLKVIDLGSGQGKLAKDLRKQGAKVLTVDKVNADFIWNLNHELPFKNKEFDLAISTAVIEHLENPWLFLEEFKRIAKICIGTTPHKRAKPILETLAKLNLINKEHIQDHKRYFTPEELKELGFECKTFELGMNIIFWRITWK